MKTDNSYRLLALDIDGTLTNSHKLVPDATREAIIDIQKRGVKVVLASGRSEYGLADIAGKLRLKDYGGYMMSFNGGRLVECTGGRIIYDRVLSLSDISGIYALAVELGTGIIGYENGCLISGNGIDEYQILDSDVCNMELKEVDDFGNYFSEPFNKCLLTGQPEHIQKVFGVVEERFGDRLSVTMSAEFFIDIMPKGIHKGAAIKKLCDILSIDRSGVVCCGDAPNDLTMIEYAGLGVAMGNAHESLKEKADYITLSNDEEGVLKVIEMMKAQMG